MERRGGREPAVEHGSYSTILGRCVAGAPVSFRDRVQALVDADPDTPGLEERFSLELSFLHRSGAMYDRLVACAVGDPVHVDMVLRRGGGPGDWIGNNFSYTAYMHEKFSVTPLFDGRFPETDKRSEMRIPLSKDEFYRVQQYLIGLVDRAEYNYSDLALLSPMVPKGAFAMVMFEEVGGFEDPSNVHKVFCSQAVVLVLKACLPGKGWMEGECSRVVSPCRLFHLVGDRLMNMNK